MGAKTKKGVGFWLSRVLIGFLLVNHVLSFSAASKHVVQVQSEN